MDKAEESRVNELIMAYKIALSGNLGQCCYETLESRRGACDGGLRCSRNAVWVIEGLPYCDRHPNREAAMLGQIHYESTRELELDLADKLAREICSHGMQA